jgi:hypothetical protein
MKNLKEAKKIWDKLADITVNANNEIEQKFMNFPTGTDIEDIWHYIENTYDVSIAIDLMDVCNN